MHDDFLPMSVPNLISLADDPQTTTKMKLIQHRKITVRTRTVRVVRTMADGSEHNGHGHHEVCPLCHAPLLAGNEAIETNNIKLLAAADETEINR